jgi:MFS family permease
LKRAFVALENRSFRLFYISTAVSGIGGQLQLVTNLWQVFALTGSPIHLGLTGLARAAAIIAFSLVGGVIADRMNRKRIIVTAQWTNGLTAAALAALTFTGEIQVWHIYAATFINAAMMATSNPARRAVIAGLVPRYHLMNAMALNSIIHQIDRIIAPAIGGILIAVAGMTMSYGVNAVAHFITAAMLTMIALGPMPTRPSVSPLRSLLEGFAFIRARNIILVLLVTDTIAMIFGSYPVLLPMIADQFDAGPAGYGMLASGPAVGGLLAATIVMSLGDFPYKGRLIMGCLLAYSGFLVVLALAPTFPVALVAVTGLGLCDTMQAAPRNAVIQLLSPDELRGRVSSFQSMLAASGPGLGQGAMGAAAGLLTPPVALISGAILCASCIVAILIQRSDLRARDLGAEQFSASIGTPSPAVRG